MAKDPYKSQGDSDSPLASRRGNADPVDINVNSPGSQRTAETDAYANTMEPKAPTEATGAGETSKEAAGTLMPAVSANHAEVPLL